MLERDIQRKLIIKAEKEGWYVVKIIQCNRPGFPDLMLLRDGKIIFIEVKRPGAKPRPLQLYRHNELSEKGMIVYVIDDINQLNKLK